MNTTPSQQELDAVAHFVEGTHELSKSPFFIEEYRSLSISMRKGEPDEKIKVSLPDSNIVAAMLVPFRRLWQQSQPCNYRKVANILKKYVPDFRWFIDSVLLNEDHAVVKDLPWFKNINLSFANVIDVWLNTRYMHVGKSSHHGQFTRQDFNKFSQEIGPALFEYYFLSAVYEAGICLFNLCQCSESFLRGFKKQGLVPSFEIRAQSQQDNIERHTPGFTPDGDSPEQRVWKLRRRKHYDGLNRFLNLISCSDQKIADVITRCNSFEAFADSLAVHFEHTDDIAGLNTDEFTHFDGCCDNYSTVVRNRRSRRGFVGKKRDGSFVCAEEYIPVLRDQYLEFRTAFVKEIFV